MVVLKISDRWRMIAKSSPYKRVEILILNYTIKIIIFYFLKLNRFFTDFFSKKKNTNCISVSIKILNQIKSLNLTKKYSYF